MRWVLACLMGSALSLVQPAEPRSSQTVGDALEAFLDHAHRGDFTRAAEALELRPGEADGAQLARRLMFLLDQQLRLAPEQLTATEGRVQVGELPLGRGRVPVELARSGDRWRFTTRTVRNIDALFGEHGSPVWDLLPPSLVTRRFGALAHWQWLGLLALLPVAWFLSRGIVAVLRPLARRLTRLTSNTLDDRLVSEGGRPVRTLLFSLLLVTGTRSLGFPIGAQALVDDLSRSVAIAAAVWALLVFGRLVADALQDKALHEKDAVSQRAIQTQVTVLHRVVSAIIIVVGGALVLVQFPGVRSIGMSLLASAGVAGVVLGLAAQRTIGNVLAGIQLSLTQPIRIGDTVIVENEWGWIEEVTLTYVVVKVWDLRRLVVPIGYFLEKPFQNWTRTSTNLLGTVELFADYLVDVDAARAELQRVLEPQRGQLWDGQTQGIQVTAMSERTMTLRVVLSAADAGKAWDLRCLVREKMIDWLRGQRPPVLPRLRADTLPAAAP
ncbi:MAG: mechanosensitive ion channel family protein [Myxococcota bacterium]